MKTEKMTKIALAVLVIMTMCGSVWAGTCEVIGYQKISDTEGGFTGVLDDEDHFGSSTIASLGDFDGDGITDIAVCSWYDDDGGLNRGAVWILFLNSDGTVKSHQKISDTEGNFTGVMGDGDAFGVHVTPIGDLNGDGVLDLAVSTLEDEGGYSVGSVWILFLNSDATVKNHQKINEYYGNFTGDLDGFDHFGRSLANLGDIDGDGVVDLAVGANQDDDGGTDRGAIWVLFLNTDGTVKSHQKISDTEGNFTGILSNYDRFGSAAAPLGDVDGDGITDLAVGTGSDDDGGMDRGAVWILFLNSDGTVKSHQKISDTEGNFTGSLDDADYFGVDISEVGDMDGDGITELAVGANKDDDGGTDRGAVWILYLNSDGTVKRHQKISDTEGNFTGSLDDVDRLGASMGGLGDLDGDGFVDIAVQAWGDDDGGTDRGSVWILFLDGPKPIAHWKFDEGSGTIAYDSAGTHHGTIYGAGWTTGQIGGALSFDGNDYVQVPNHNSLCIEDAFTLSAFIKIDDSWNLYGRIICKRHDVSGNGYAFVLYDEKRPRLFTEMNEMCASDESVSLDTWTHVVATYDWANQRTAIYIDGNEVGYATVTNKLTCSSYPLTFGKQADIGSNYFSGLIDDVRIYNRALSAAEIKELYISVPPVGKTYHVDGVNGDNTNDGLTKNTAFKTIQRGVNVAEDDDTVLVWPGIYKEEIGFWGDAITVKSAADAAVVETDYGYAFSFYSAEDPDTILSNFVIRDSQYGIYLVNGAGPTLTNLTIVNNDFGISAFNGADPDIRNCILWGNKYGDLFRDPLPLQAKYSWLQEEVEKGLVAHWKLDGDANDSAGNNDGTIYSATPTTGQIGSAFSFDGMDDYVDIPGTSDLNPLTFTLSAWIKYINYNEDNLIVGKHYCGVSGGYFLGIYYDKAMFWLSDEPPVRLHTSETYRDNQWHHLTGAYDGMRQYLYVDGILAVQRDKVYSLFSSENIHIGGIFRGPCSNGNSAFTGTIDEVRIYDRALSAEEIEAIYKTGLAGLSYGGPGFVDANSGDYHLLSERGRYWPAYDIWVLDKVTSPCINGGDPAVDPSSEPMPNGGRINMGAYGNSAYASMSECWSKADINCDGVVNFKDFAIMADNWLKHREEPTPEGMVWVYINDDGSGMIDKDGNPIDKGGFTGYMSKYEITNAQYCQFLNAALASGDIIVDGNDVKGANGSNIGVDFIDVLYFETYAADSFSQITYSGGTFSVRTRDANDMSYHPVVDVSWYGATAFASYYGCRLPTEWEWQAVADYDGSYTYGCGTTIDHTKANYDNDNPLGLSSVPYTSPVDYYSSYGYGMNDMAGNVWEWTSSCYYAGCYPDYRVIRGGSWDNDDNECEVSHRFDGNPNYCDAPGFRVVLGLE